MASSPGLPSEDRAPTDLSLLVSPPPWLGSQLSSSLLISFTAFLNDHLGQAPRCARVSRARHTPEPRPHSSRQGESQRVGRPCFSRNVRRTRTQTMIPPHLQESLSAPATRGAAPAGTPLLPKPPGARGRTPQTPPAPPTPFQLSRGNRGESLGAGPFLARPHPPRLLWGVGEGHAGWTLYLSPNSLPRLPRRVVTQKRGTWCQLHKSLSTESCHPEVPLSETPRIPPRLRLLERQGPCPGYLGCRREVVQVTGWS